MNTKWLKLRNKYTVIYEPNKVKGSPYTVIDEDYSTLYAHDRRDAIDVVKNLVLRSVPAPVRNRHNNKISKARANILVRKYAIYPPGVANKCKK